jgi:starch synthase
MRILFATSEARPLIKTGGLADVSGALPAALRAIGIDCRLLLPGYPAVLAGVSEAKAVATLHGLPDATSATLLEAVIADNGVPLYILDVPELFQREGGPYQDVAGHDHPDNALRFAVFSKAAALLASADSPLEWRPQVLHCNDWQTGLAPAYLSLSGGTTPSVMTVHNLAYQGIFPPTDMDMVELPPECFSLNGVEYYGNLSFLKAGLFYASKLTTVSPSYAEEIRLPALGMGMQGLLNSRGGDLVGILNGIDTGEWDPSTDVYLPFEFSARAPSGKKRCKLKLQQDLNLEPGKNTPLFGVIARLAHQKGLDLILAVAEGILHRGGQIALLGTGEKALEAAFRDLGALHPGRVAAVIGYDEGLSHRIEAGADIFLMPSRFEPCGLNQLYSLRYGTVPIVHATGGLKDTVEDGVTGFVFQEPTAHALWLAVDRALHAYADGKEWQRMMRAGMSRDFSWEKSAREYAALYQGLLDTP